MTRVVLDANVLASAAVGHSESPSRRVLEATLDGQLEMVGCEMLFDEVDRALASRYFADRLNSESRAAIITLLRDTAAILPDPVASPAEIRDPKDDYLVALARAAAAEAIVTGDKDLLEHESLTPPAITSREACERFDLP